MYCTHAGPDWVQSTEISVIYRNIFLWVFWNILLWFTEIFPYGLQKYFPVGFLKYFPVGFLKYFPVVSRNISSEQPWPVMSAHCETERVWESAGQLCRVPQHSHNSSVRAENNHTSLHPSEHQEKLTLADLGQIFSRHQVRAKEILIPVMAINHPPSVLACVLF